MKNIKTITMVMAALTFLFAACTKEETKKSVETTINKEVPIPTNLIKVGESYIIGSGAKAVIYSEKALFAGYNKLYIAMYDSVNNSRLTAGHFDFSTLMDMGTMKHSSPYEVTEDIDSLTQLWYASAVFIMPGTWNLKLSFHNNKNDKEGENTLAVNVAIPTSAMVKNFIVAADDSSKIIVSLLKPASPKIGLNDFEITIHKNINMMEFPAVNDYRVEIEPTMPSMGHGSPNNINPIHTENGHYKGVVNFTMSGLWKVNLTLKKNNVLLDKTQYFEITF